MLILEIHADDLVYPWHATPQGWAAGRSVIQPYRHDALHAELRCSARRSVVVVRERGAGAAHQAGLYKTPGETTWTTERELDRWLDETRRWPLDFVLLVIDGRDTCRRVKLTAGSWGTAPLYLHAAHDVLRASWDVADLYPHLQSTELDIHFASQYLLSLNNPYSRRTIFPEITRLTERARAHWSPPFDRVRITYPPAIDHSVAHRLRSRADVVGTFREILQSSMRRSRYDEQQPIAVELSGGLDSTLIVATAATLPAPATFSYGLIMPGQPGEYQRLRRNEVVERAGLLDREFPCCDYPPFNPRSHRVRGNGTVMWGEYYEEAVTHLVELVRADGLHTIYTGMGGDELCSYQFGELRADEQEGDDALRSSGFPEFVNRRVVEAFKERHKIDDAPPALSYTSVMESAVAVAPVYLRNGVWPISPLTTPELVEFCRKLPLAWRHRRKIHRQVLASFGYSKRVAFPKPAHLETFVPVMNYSLGTVAASVIEDVFVDSLVEAQGLIDGRALLRAYHRFRAGSAAPHIDQILGALVLELTLRSVERRRSVASKSASETSSHTERNETQPNRAKNSQA
jgi:asparagine synthase (glutamine-hydrolysing)